VSKDIDTFLAQYNRESREMALCLRTLILDVFPRGVEIIDPKSGIIAYGFNRTSKGLVCAIQPHMKHVNLMFSQGAKLTDPTKLLAGTGKQARHVRITSEDQTQNPALRALLEEALKLNYT
jgi:hypothetical protein